MTGVLEALRVLDLSSGISGPMTAMLLADQGARVVKVEPPGGDPERSDSGWRVWNRGKKSLGLDLNTPEGQLTLRELVARVDIVIEGIVPNMSDGSLVNYEEACLTNPGLIHCTISGYGDLSRHSGRPVTDSLVAARTGLQWEKRGWPGGSIERVNGVEPFLEDLAIDPDDMEGPPRPGPLFSVIPWPSLSAFYLASIGVSSALHVRELTGQGQRVHTSLLQGALVNGTFCWQRVDHPDRPGYRMWVTDPRVHHGFYQTADNRWVHHWVPQPSFVLGVSAGDFLEVRPDTAAPRNDDMRMGMDPEDLLVMREYLQPMQEAFRRFTASEWEEVAAQASVSVQTVRSPEEAFLDEAFVRDGCVIEVQDPEQGAIRHVGITYHLHAAPASTPGPAPRPGEHTKAVLAEFLGADGQRADTHPRRDAPSFGRGPLDGVVVLDLGLAVAGPFGTQMLADLGAGVIKVNRDTDRVWTDYYMGMCCNRGKRSITIDLKSVAGLEVLKTLVQRADVVHTNMHWDSAQRLKVDYASLRAVNPRLIYCHTRGFENGDRLLLPGHDQSGSALAGVAWEEGGLYDGGKPIWPNISLGDLGNGMLSATAVIQALYHRDRTGEGQFVDTSIVYVHLLNASRAWAAADGSTVSPRARLDAMQFGTGPLHRLYETSKGWLCVDIHATDHWLSLCDVLGRPDLARGEPFPGNRPRTVQDHQLEAILAAVFASRSAEEWFEILNAAGVPVEISSETFGQTWFDDREMRERELVVTHEHPLVGRLEMFGRMIDLSTTPGKIERGPIVPGMHTREILSEHGYDDAAVDALVASGAVSEFVPAPTATA
jgi:crotonobetainyl-CoA:carnitine CoA-transferase CaiB-like acyl-CoA transferase